MTGITCNGTIREIVMAVIRGGGVGSSTSGRHGGSRIMTIVITVCSMSRMKTMRLDHIGWCIDIIIIIFIIFGFHDIHSNIFGLG